MKLAQAGGRGPGLPLRQKDLRLTQVVDDLLN